MQCPHTAAFLAGLAVAACGGRGGPPAVPVPADRILSESLPPSRMLPPVPTTRGPLALRVAYPAPDAVLEIRDSSFLFGTAGNGEARVTVNGQPARVWPNGAWLAYVAIGRAKKAVGDLTGDSSMRSQGRREERKGEEKEKLAEAQDRVEDKAKDVADLERRT